jgi:hypothetical protein
VLFIPKKIGRDGKFFCDKEVHCFCKVKKLLINIFKEFGMLCMKVRNSLKRRSLPLKSKFVVMLSGAVLSAMVLGGCGSNNNNVNDDNIDHRGPLMRINNPANDNRNIDNNVNRNRMNNDNINNHDNFKDPNNINNHDNINTRDRVNDPHNVNNNDNINNRGNINNDLNNNGNNNYLSPTKDKNTDTDKDLIKDSNTKKEDIIEDDIDRKDRDNRDE